MKKMIIILVAALMAPTAQAAWSDLGEVTDVFSHNEYHIVRTTIPDNPCGTAGKFYWPISDADAKDMLSLSMAAFMSGKRVSFGYNENNPVCLWGGIVASHMRITNQ